jgi:hypothetical protein
MPPRGQRQTVAEQAEQRERRRQAARRGAQTRRQRREARAAEPHPSRWPKAQHRGTWRAVRAVVRIPTF